MNSTESFSQAAPVETHRCVGCCRPFPKEDLMAFTGFYACPECKPDVIAKIARGEPPGSLFRHGRRLVVKSFKVVPDRCVKCNAPAGGRRIDGAVYRHHPAIYLLLPAIPIYIIVATLCQRSLAIRVGLCAVHFKRRRGKIALGWLLAIAGMIAGFTGVVSMGNISEFAAVLLMASIVMILGGIVTIVVASRVVGVHRVTGEFIVLNGIHPDYLAELPQWPG